MTTLPLKQRRKRKRLGPYSKPHSLTTVDGRCRVAKCVREFARELAQHVGGEPTPAQRVLIREASVKNAKLGLLVDKILNAADPDMDLATRCYLAWANSLRRDLESLGLERPEQRPARLADVLRPVKAA